MAVDSSGSIASEGGGGLGRTRSVAALGADAPQDLFGGLGNVGQGRGFGACGRGSIADVEHVAASAEVSCGFSVHAGGWGK